ncbi:MAG: DUF4886 domain-containing protein [Lautropia sp.]
MKPSRSSIVAIACAAALALGASAAARAQAQPQPQPAPAPAAASSPTTAPAPSRLLMVGNSYLYYNDSIHNHLRRIAVAADPSLEKKLQYKSATIGGAALVDHPIEHLTTPGRIGVKGAFEVVLLQGNSGAALSEAGRKRYHDAVVAFDKVIRSHGGRTALYLTHAYVAPHPKADPGMIRKTEAMVTGVAREIGALVVPVGLAFEQAYKRRPDLRLHKDYDGSHPELVGSYLAACVLYASLYGKSPVGNGYDYYGRIDKDTTAFLQQVAQDTVTAFNAR